MKAVAKKNKIGIGEEPRKKNRSAYGCDKIKGEVVESVLTWMEEALDRCHIDHAKELRGTGCNVTVLIDFSVSEEEKNAVNICVHERSNLKAESECLAAMIYENFKVQRPDDLICLTKGKGMLLNCKELYTRASILIQIKKKPSDKENGIEIRDLKQWREYGEILCKSICEFLDVPYVIHEQARFTVQAGAYRLISNAIGIRDKLIGHGFEDACIKKGKLYGSDVFRVQTGSFKNFENVQILAKQLRANNFYAVIREIL